MIRPYEVLGVAPGASDEEIRQAYEKLSAIFAADSLALYSLVDESETRRHREEVRAAFRLLSDNQARRAWDEANGIAPESSLQPSEIPDEASPADQSATSEPDREEDEVVLELGDEDVLEVEDLAAPAPPQSLGLVRTSPPPAPARPSRSLPRIDENTEFTGALLREVREVRGISLRDVSTRTRIGVNHLESIEEEAFSRLPDRVFLRGFLQSYARELRLDPARVAETYLARRGIR
ncbi:helix-turn-helix domain-containing protein [Vulgatibacter incomptus]|uniref:DnaJ domain protein n=1 Tax=Vulgatibacter incomptus TaxID=1391653 RepID=A0A0K1PCP5_9BACT|nr:helix-turn-helix transcriptional regulator [Vulgatibacter incomptus]AKU91272.1 DnaJ domain protein [Vulgatibacter incomptus]